MIENEHDLTRAHIAPTPHSRELRAVFSWALRCIGRGPAIGLGAAFAFVASPAAAAQVPVRISYTAPAACPAESVFVEGVKSRARQSNFAQASELARAFDVTIRNAAGEASFVGHLEFAAADGQRATRDVAGSTCDEVVSSLALITALAIDDRAAEGDDRAAEGDDRAAQAEPSASPPAPLPSPPPVAPSTPPKKIEPSGPPRLAEPPGADRPTRGGVRWDVGGNAGLSSWLTPRAALEFGAFLQVGSRNPSWSVRLSGFDARQTKDVTGVGSARFATDWLRLEGCPVALGLRSHFSLSLCAAFDGGALRATGVKSGALSNTSDKTIFWRAAVALLRLGWVVDQRLVLGLDGELAVPLLRHSFVFQNPTTNLYEVPKIGFGTKIALAVRFP